MIYISPDIMRIGEVAVRFGDEANVQEIQIKVTDSDGTVHANIPTGFVLQVAVTQQVFPQHQPTPLVCATRQKDSDGNSKRKNPCGSGWVGYCDLKKASN